MLYRIDILKILNDEKLRKELLAGTVQFIQNLEGIDTTKEQAEAAYDNVRSSTPEEAQIINEFVRSKSKVVITKPL